MKQRNFREQPTCPMSVHCLRLIDDLDAENGAREAERLYTTDDIQDARLVEQLHTHIPTCAVCKATIAQGRRMRTQQRAVLSSVLNESEFLVPSTTAQILSSIRQEQRTLPTNGKYHHQLQEVMFEPGMRGEKEWQKDQTTPRSRVLVLFRNALAVAIVAAIVLTAVGIFNRYNFVRTGTTFASPTPTLSLAGWSSIIIGLVRGSRSGNGTSEGGVTITNYDAASGRNISFGASNSYPANTRLDGVSHNGQRLLYHYDGGNGKTYYYLLPPDKADAPEYVATGKGGNGVWSTDDKYVYISTESGIVEVSVETGEARSLVSSIQMPHLYFYHSGFLYFENGSTFYRVSTVDGSSHIIIQKGANWSLADFMLSPSGSQIYYVDRKPSGGAGIHMVDSDGTNLHDLRQETGVMLLGFAADSSLMMINQKGDGKFQVMKLGATAEQDQVVLTDAVPGAQTLSEGSVALAPFGRELVAMGTYSDGSRKIYYNDLAAGVQRILLVPDNDTQVQMPGWDRLAVPGISPQPSLTATPTTSQDFSGWNSIALAGESDAKSGLWNVTNASYLNGQSGSLLSVHLQNPRFDGISPDGMNLLYRISSSGHTLYFTRNQLSGTGFFYELTDANAGNAIWLPDSRNVLIATQNSGVLKVDTQTGQFQTLISTLKTTGIRFYRDGYLYFLGGEDRALGALYRVNVASGVTQQVTFRSQGATYWLSPDGRTVYFANTGGPSGELGIYAVNSDGTNSRLLRTYVDGTPIGYAGDSSLMIMRVQNGKFEVLKLGATPQQDVVIAADVAPRATSLCDSNTPADLVCDRNVALAPYGHALLVQATNRDGSLSVWSDDLISGKQFVLLTPANSLPVQFIGWDRIPVS